MGTINQIFALKLFLQFGTNFLFIQRVITVLNDCVSSRMSYLFLFHSQYKQNYIRTFIFFVFGNMYSVVH